MQLQQKPDADALIFGKHFTDHMLKIFWHKSLGGWQKPEITPMESIAIHPAAKVLHYAVEVSRRFFVFQKFFSYQFCFCHFFSKKSFFFFGKNVCNLISNFFLASANVFFSNYFLIFFFANSYLKA